jgi:hypothetical protein
MKQLMSIAVIFAAGVSSAQAEPKTWDNIRAVAPGGKIRVQTAAQKQTGTLISVDDNALRFKASDATEVTTPRSEIIRVYSQSKSHRRRNFIIGAVTGVAIGAVTYGTLGALLRNESDEETGALLFVPIAVGGALGAALPTGRMKLIYDAKKQ